MVDTLRSTRHTRSNSVPLRVDQPSADPSFDAVFDTSAEALVLMDAAGLIHRANRRGRELLRIQEHAGNAGLGDFLAGPSAGCIRAFRTHLDSASEPQALETSLSNGFPVRIALRAILPGSELLLLCLEEGPIVERADARWRQLQAELRSVLDSVAVGVLLVDATGRVRFSNARFGELFGLGPREVTAMATFRALQEVLAERFEDPENFSAPWNSFIGATGEPVHDELELTRPARRIIKRYSRPVLDNDGRAVGWLELYSDVTTERQIQSKMLQTQKMAALGHLVSGVAHELNNPLTAIVGYTDLLLGREIETSRFAEATRLFQEAERARRIVKNLLYFARENKTEHIASDINEIVERTLALRSYELNLQNISVRCELAPDLPRTMADPHQLQQVILNLLINAEQALLEQRRRGCIWIRTSRSRRNTGNRAGEWISLEVADDGPGIPSDIASRIFEPFFTTKPPGAGTGLGLSIGYRIVQQHGGEVTFKNQPGAGVRFLVELPVVPAKEIQHAGKPVSPSLPLQTVRSSRVLVVEDEPTIAQLIADVLGDEGHDVEAVTESQDGLARIFHSDYDLIICDLRMPRLDGASFYEALVRASNPAQHRLLFITGDTLTPSTAEFLASRSLPCLAKPFLVEELKAAVNHLLTVNRSQATQVHRDAPGENRRRKN